MKCVANKNQLSKTMSFSSGQLLVKFSNKNKNLNFIRSCASFVERCDCDGSLSVLFGFNKEAIPLTVRCLMCFLALFTGQYPVFWIESILFSKTADLVGH